MTKDFVTVVIHYRNGTSRTEIHTEYGAWKLTTTYNKTAFDYKVIDFWVEEVK